MEEEEHLTFERLLHIWLEARKGYNSGGDVCKCQIRLKEHLQRDFPRYFANQGHERSILSKLLKEYNLFWCSLTLSEREQSHCRLWYLVVARLDRGATDSHQARRKSRRRKIPWQIHITHSQQHPLAGGEKNTTCNRSETEQRWWKSWQMFPSLVSAQIYRDALIHLHTPSSCYTIPQNHTLKSYVPQFSAKMQYFLQKFSLLQFWQISVTRLPI